MEKREDSKASVQVEMLYRRFVFKEIGLANQ